MAATIEKTAKEVGYDIQTNIADAWTTAGESVKLYSSTFTQESSGVISVIGTIKNSWEKATEAADAYAQAAIKATQSKTAEVTGTGKSDTNNTTEATANTSSGTKSATSISTSNAKSLLQTVRVFIKNNAIKGTQSVDKYASLNKYIYEATGGMILSKTNEKKLGELLGLKLTTDLSGTDGAEELEKIKKALVAIGWTKSNSGFANGGIIDLQSAVKKTGEDGIVIASNNEAVITEEQWKMIRNLGNGLTDMQQFKPYIPDIQTREIAPVYNIDSSITVDGIATNEIVKDMAKVATKQAENVIANINRRTYAKGVRV